MKLDGWPTRKGSPDDIEWKTKEKGNPSFGLEWRVCEFTDILSKRQYLIEADQMRLLPVAPAQLFRNESPVFGCVSYFIALSECEHMLGLPEATTHWG